MQFSSLPGSEDDDEEKNFILSWKDITVSIRLKKQGFWQSNTYEKTILDRVSGEAKSGSLVAIMGPSGAGKTTLLAALAGKISKDTGLVQINDRVLTNAEIKTISGYLHQHFVVVESLTAKEHLIFMSALKLNVKRDQRKVMVKKLIFELNLESCMDTSIRNLSGGERKRIALAVELLDDPLIVYCDEPTTGLDSSSATAVIEILHDKAVAGKLVIATIHQPSSQLYNYFNDIILIGSGKIIFQGHQEQARDFFNGIDLRCPESYNPADFYIHHITMLTKNSANLEQLDDWIEIYKRKNHTKKSCVSNGLKFDLQVKLRKRHSFVQLFWLVWRCYIDTKRNMGYQAIQFGFLLFTALIISILYSDIKIDNENSVQNFKGVLFFITSELIFTHLYAVIYVFPEEYNVFLQEESLYSSCNYFLSKIIAFTPKCILQPFAFLLIVFLQVQFESGFPLLLKMLIILVIGCISATAYGLCISAVFQSLECIELVILPLDLFSMLMAGIMLKVSTIPFYVQWIKYSSPFFFVYESLSILQWSNVTTLVCSNKTSLPCYKNGTDVLEELGFNTNYSEIPINLLGMCLLTSCFCFIGYLGIVRKQKQSFR